ncbi:MAG: 23S rRNA (guanosine(2251)-2'-O)-methyltransferase RlmB [Lachnospiraceae bacterium]|nr:23S rRNA (guanosine(2251)-2'-O)-methyltransferase RlmB [Lachnospiraceae bacterium]
MRYEEISIEGRNAVTEALRAGTKPERILLQSGLKDPAIEQVKKLALSKKIKVDYVSKEELDRKSETKHHQGVMAVGANYQYAEVDEMLALARERGEDPFLILLDGIEDPHNLGAIIRTANLAGAHGVVILKNRSASVNSTVARTSAGAVAFTPVARVANLSALMEQLKKEGMWFVCADMDGTVMYDLNLTGPIGLVIGNEGSGVSRLVREHCDMIASIPMKGNIDSLNASVAAGVLSYEIVRQKVKKL